MVLYPKCTYGPIVNEIRLKWCIHLDIFLYFNHFTHLVSVSAGGPESTCSQVLRSTSVDSKRFERIDIFRVEIH